MNVPIRVLLGDLTSSSNDQRVGGLDAIAARRVYGDALLGDFPFSVFVSKTIRPEPRGGNEPQRIWETPAGMINSIGLPNKGLAGFLAEDLPQLAELPVPLIVSVMATDQKAFARLVAAVGERDEVAGIELNVSCPNVHSGLIVECGLPHQHPEGQRDRSRDGRARHCRRARGPLRSRGAAHSRRPGTRGGGGGEPADHWHGGISPAADAVEMFAAGAALVAVGTENFRDPRAGDRVAAGIAGTLKFRRSNTPVGNSA